MPAGPKPAADPSPLPFECDPVGVQRFATFCAESQSVRRFLTSMQTSQRPSTDSVHSQASETAGQTRPNLR